MKQVLLARGLSAPLTKLQVNAKAEVAPGHVVLCRVSLAVEGEHTTMGIRARKDRGSEIGDAMLYYFDITAELDSHLDCTTDVLGAEEVSGWSRRIVPHLDVLCQLHANEPSMRSVERARLDSVLERMVTLSAALRYTIEGHFPSPHRLKPNF